MTPPDGRGLVWRGAWGLLLRWREVTRESYEHAGRRHAERLGRRDSLPQEHPGPDQARYGHERLGHWHVLRVALDQKPEEDERDAVDDGRDRDADALLCGQWIRPDLATVQSVVREHERGREAHEDHVGPGGCGVARHSGDDGPSAKADGGDEDEGEEKELLQGGLCGSRCGEFGLPMIADSLAFVYLSTASDFVI